MTTPKKPTPKNKAAAKKQTTAENKARVSARHRANEKIESKKKHVPISKCRERIKAYELIGLLQDNSLNPRKKPLHANKLAAIKMLLDRAVPILRSTEIIAQVDGKITISWED